MPKKKTTNKKKSTFVKILKSAGDFIKGANIEVDVQVDDFVTNIRKNEGGDFNVELGLDGVTTGIDVNNKNIKFKYDDKV